MTAAAPPPPKRPTLELVSHEAFLPRRARSGIGESGESRSDAMVSVLHEWLHHPDYPVVSE
jgi:hypothetical protein